jgi:hypothetical protein
VISRARARLRAVLRIGAIAVATLAFYVARLACLPLAPVAPRAFGRAHLALMRTWARTTLRVMGVRLRQEGRPPEPPFLLVANHLSYVDILVLLASLRETALRDRLEELPHNLSEALTVAAVHRYLESRQRAFDALGLRGTLTVDVEPELLPARIVNRYLEVKRSGLL